MSEKELVTIDCDLTIPEGVEKVFENQHITLNAGIRCNGKLIFRDCEIEPGSTQSGSKEGRRACKPGRIEISGTLEMEGCKVIRPGRGFLFGIDFDCDMIIKSTAFLRIPYSDSEIATEAFRTPCVIIAREKAKLEGCSFVGEMENAPQTSELALIKCATAIVDNCTFENITGRIEVDAISDSSFTGCASIESVDVIGSTFTDCKSITANSGCFKNCNFVHVGNVSALSSDVDSCRFQNIENNAEDEGIVFIDDSKITQCTFENVDLQNNSYLIEGGGDSSVDDCQFIDCRTDREDSELCHCEVKNSHTSMSLPTGLLKGALKLAGSAALGAAGLAATLAREAGNATRIDVLTGVAGTIQDASFEKIRDMWTPDEKKDEAYYEAQAERSERRAADAERKGKQVRKQYFGDEADCEDED